MSFFLKIETVAGVILNRADMFAWFFFVSQRNYIVGLKYIGSSKMDYWIDICRISDNVRFFSNFLIK